MKFPIKINTVYSEWSILYVEGSQVILSKTYYISFSEIDFVLISSADPIEMPQYALLHLGLHCLPKYCGSRIQRVNCNKMI